MNTESSSKMKENEEMRTLPELLGCVGQGGDELGDELGVGLGGEMDDKLGEG